MVETSPGSRIYRITDQPGFKKGAALNLNRLVKAEKLLVLALKSGYLRDVRDRKVRYGKLDANSRIISAMFLVRRAIKIQRKP